MRLFDLLDESRVMTGLARAPKRQLLDRMVRALAQAGDVRDPERVIEALCEREKLTSTGIGGGYAIPHTVSSNINRPVLAVGAVAQGAEYESPDGAPVHFLFLLLISTDAQKHQLKLLGRLARILSDRSLLADLHAAGDDAKRICELLRARETACEQRFGS